MNKFLSIAAMICFMFYAGPASATLCDTLNPPVTISASAVQICAGTAVTFTAVDTGGVFAPNFQWHVNGSIVGANSSVFTSQNFNNGDSVWVLAIRVNNCGDTFYNHSNKIQLIVNATPQPPILNLIGGACLGADSIGYVLNPSASQINWYVNGSLTDTLLVTIDSPATVIPVTSAEPLSMAVRGSTLYVSMEGAYAVWGFPIDTVNAFVGNVIAGGNGLGNAANQFVEPASLTFDSQGNLYVCDPQNNRVQMFPPGSNSSTNGVTVAGGNGSGTALNQFNIPGSVAVDASGTIYVADISNNRVLKFPAGSTSATMGTIVAGGNGTGSALNQLYYAEAIFLDRAGNIYVADGGNSRVLKFPPNSTSATMGTIVAGGNGYGSAANQLSVPFGLYMDASGYLFVTDRDNSRIQMFPPNSSAASNAVTIAGGNGSGSSITQLYNPIAPVVFDSSGSYMFVDDRSNQRVLRFNFRRYLIPTVSGTYTATYTAPDGCVSSVSDSVDVYAAPVVTLTWDSLIAENFLSGTPQLGLWCRAHSPSIVPLKGGLPAGGTYSGGSVFGDTLNLTQWAVNDTDVIHYTYTNTYGCSASAADIIVNTACTGLNEIEKANAVSVYPNPCNNSFSISGNYTAGTMMQMYDLTGRLILCRRLENGNTEISTETVAAGVYTVNIAGAAPETAKLVITH